MSGPAVPLTNVGNGYTIVTHVFSPQTGTSETQQNVSSGGSVQKFLKGEPKALGTVQIMIGLLMFLFGIVILTDSPPIITVYSRISFWGSLLFIITGSLAVSASNKLHRCVVNGALTMNVFSAVTAAIAIYLLSMDLAFSERCYDDYEYGSRYKCSSRKQSRGIAGVLLVFCVLQFIISIFIAAHSCRASCNTEPAVNITVVPNQEGFCSVVNPFPTQNNPQWMYGAGGATASSAPMESPPEYSETKCPPDN
ncbi:membrane-spanning 4-domains subfamily A member 4A [Astyanax mexicanus]|uniref:membrane-spanning 4-domains subfamily A member 4A n=1 Tax=Astyanax mexicanus TaxID=7994 RepID=UPI0020CAF1FA|nr:membrane-spanning 4-domains subfamily A member 4A [Astyanax mexicanus]